MDYPLITLRQLRDERRQLDKEMQAAIADAFAVGHTVSDVGQVLGLAPSTAHRRFGHLMPRSRRRHHLHRPV